MIKLINKILQHTTTHMPPSNHIEFKVNSSEHIQSVMAGVAEEELHFIWQGYAAKLRLNKSKMRQ